MSDMALVLRVLAETREAEARLRELARGLDQTGDASRRSAAGTAAMVRESDALQRAAASAAGAILGKVAAYGAATLSVRALLRQTTAMVQSFATVEAQGLGLNAVIAATGGAAGRASEDIERLVQDLARLGSESGAEAIRNAATQLLTFTEIAGEQFDRTMLAAVNLSASGFGSVEQAALQLGKALQNPAEGLAGLTRVGVTFTEEQQRLIRSLAETGRTAEAQRVILAAVETQVGGTAAARGAGLAGAFRILSHELGEFGEVVGDEIARMLDLDARLRRVAAGVSTLRQAIAGEDPLSSTELGTSLDALRAERDGLRAVLDAPGGEGLAAAFASAQAEAEALGARVAEVRGELIALQREGVATTVTAPLYEQLQALADEWEAAQAQAEALRRAIREAPAGSGPSNEAVAAAARLVEVEAQIAATEARLAAVEARAAEATAKGEERQRELAEQRLRGVISALEDEEAAARLSAEAQEVRKAAIAAGVRGDAEAEAQILRLVQAIRAAKAEAQGEAQIALFDRQAEVARIAAAYGEDSVQATQARLVAERAAVEEMARAAGMADDLRDRLLDAWDAMKGLAGTDITGPIAAARIEARELGREIADAFGAVARLGQRLAERKAEADLRLRHAGDPVGLAGAMARREAEGMLPAVPDFGDGGIGRTLGRALTVAREHVIEQNAQLARDAEAANQAALAAERALAGGGGRSGGGGGGGGAAARDAVAELQTQVAAMLTELGLAEAAAAEKMRVGLIGATEAGDAMAAAKRRAAERLAELVVRFDALGPAGEAGAEQARAALAALADEVGNVAVPALEGAAKGIEGAFENAFTAWVKGSRDAGRGMVDAILSELSRLAFQRWVQPLLSVVLDALPFERGGVVAQGVQAFAAGGVPAALPPLRGFRDEVVTEPTLFAMGAAGAGLMGEAGPEAIMPLMRGAGGAGVRALLSDGSETLAPLARAASGHLAIRLPEPAQALAAQAFARGGVPAGTPGWVGDALRPARAAAGPGAAATSAPAPSWQTRVEVHNNAASGGERVREERTMEGDTEVLRVIIDRVEDGLAANLGRGVGPLNAAMRQFGLRRPGR